ncbi:Uma2 family endonuclease [Gloeobacter kilaueensis]|uniref:Putative restriction endonuclease domain-containing protein n=1 Tax=Gloeobacter kilaueensis (strain ATCC BAA-2537 / CCAP 1431/1 / ULC 316 / JS1) TaxID=1183438 RepID=U5QJW3_GLOK1|nr:Uma2 family endonuclease [Gloeobacter kilaueensis]AGY59216.1 hypothetical protein GKIL_2970 [Gloeobacter kilaueensis JS1]
MQDIKNLEGSQSRLFSASEYYRMVEADMVMQGEQWDGQRGRIVTAHAQREHLWSVDAYYRLAALGILHPEERLELINGQILTMSPQGPLHAETVELIAAYLRVALAGRFLIRNEKPVHLSDLDEPVPDLAVVEVLRYSAQHPVPDQIRLIIEVADSSLDFDRKVKSKLYARAGIQECWVVNIRQRQLHVFTQPTDLGYQSENVLTENTMTLPCLGGVSVAVSELLVPN